MRLWHNGFTIPQETDAEHKARKSAGGEDFPLPNASSLYAPADGMLRARNGGTGGWTLSLDPDGYPDITDIEVMHCSDLNGLVLNGSRIRVTEGQYVGRSGGRKGAPGAGNSDGPHTHEHIDLADGTRTGITVYMQAHGTATAAADTTTPEDEMKLITIICDQGKPGESEYGSTAVIKLSGEFERTSTGMEDRGALQARVAIADSLGVTVDERHVDNNGFIMAPWIC